MTLNVSLTLHPVSAKRVLDYLSASIQKMLLLVHQVYRLGTEIRVSNWPSQYDSRVRKATNSHPNLESLTISSYFKIMLEHTLLGFLSTCTSNPKSFSCPETNCFESRSPAAALNNIGLFSEVFGPCCHTDRNGPTLITPQLFLGTAFVLDQS